MFQNLSGETPEQQNGYYEDNKKVSTKDVLKRLFAKQSLILIYNLFDIHSRT